MSFTLLLIGLLIYMVAFPLIMAHITERIE